MAFYCIFSAESKFVRVCHNVSSPVGRSGGRRVFVTCNFNFQTDRVFKNERWLKMLIKENTAKENLGILIKPFTVLLL